MSKETTTTAEKTASKIAKKRLLLLDSHAILHRAYHALPDFASAKGEPTGAILGVEDGTANAPLRGLGSVGILAQSTVTSTGTIPAD